MGERPCGNRASRVNEPLGEGERSVHANSRRAASWRGPGHIWSVGYRDPDWSEGREAAVADPRSGRPIGAANGVPTPAKSEGRSLPNRRAMRRGGEPYDDRRRAMRRLHPPTAASHANKGRLRPKQDLENQDRFTWRSPAGPVLASIARSLSGANPWSGSSLVAVSVGMRSPRAFLDEEMTWIASSRDSPSPHVRPAWVRPWRSRVLATATSPPPEGMACAACGKPILASRKDPKQMGKCDGD